MWDSSSRPSARGQGRGPDEQPEELMAEQAQEGLEELPTMKVKNSCGKEIPLVQGKEKQLCFVGAAVKRYPMPKVRETQVRW